jgi:hypothetical protein
MVMETIYPDEARLEAFAGRLGQYDKELTSALRKAMTAVVTPGKRDVKAYMRSWKHPLRKPAKDWIKSKVKVDGPGQVFGQVKGQFYAMLEMCGRAPGRFVTPRGQGAGGTRRRATPNRVSRNKDALAALEVWVQDKLGVPADKARQAAFAVAVNIGKRGTKGSGAMEKARPELQARADLAFGQAMDAIMAYLKGSE